MDVKAVYGAKTLSEVTLGVVGHGACRHGQDGDICLGEGFILSVNGNAMSGQYLALRIILGATDYTDQLHVGSGAYGGYDLLAYVSVAYDEYFYLLVHLKSAIELVVAYKR